jgi:hypothetical protein
MRDRRDVADGRDANASLSNCSDGRLAATAGPLYPYLSFTHTSFSGFAGSF